MTKLSTKHPPTLRPIQSKTAVDYSRVIKSLFAVFCFNYQFLQSHYTTRTGLLAGWLVPSLGCSSPQMSPAAICIERRNGAQFPQQRHDLTEKHAQEVIFFLLPCTRSAFLHILRGTFPVALSGVRRYLFGTGGRLGKLPLGTWYT